MIATPIQTIKQAADACRHPELERIVWLDNEIGLYSLADAASHCDCFLDVPLRSIVALGRKDFWKTGDTWTQALAGVEGTGWPSEIFGYFGSELRDREFPAPGSRRELRLQCVGGACQVGNGNHRLVAGKNWLISQKGGDARLLKAKVSYCRLPAAVKELLARAVRGGFEIRVSVPRFGTSKACHVLICRDWRYELWAWDGEDLTLERRHKALAMLTWWFERATPDFTKNWKPLPRNVAEAMIDDDWAARQLPPATGMAPAR